MHLEHKPRRVRHVYDCEKGVHPLAQRAKFHFCATGLLMVLCKNRFLVTRHFWPDNTVQEPPVGKTLLILGMGGGGGDCCPAP